MLTSTGHNASYLNVHHKLCCIKQNTTVRLYAYLCGLVFSHHQDGMVLNPTEHTFKYKHKLAKKFQEVKFSTLFLILYSRILFTKLYFSSQVRNICGNHGLGLKGLK